MNNQQEIWKDIEDYEDLYRISTLGNILSLKFSGGNRGVILQNEIHTEGYRKITLWNGTKSRYFVHRLVAIAFIPNPDNKRTVNHKNGIRSDNRVENLEWNTDSENNLHSFRELGRKVKSGKDSHVSKSVSQYSKLGVYIETFVSQLEAHKITGIDSRAISAACTGRYKSAGGYIWKFDNNKTT